MTVPENHVDRGAARAPFFMACPPALWRPLSPVHAPCLGGCALQDHVARLRRFLKAEKELAVEDETMGGQQENVLLGLQKQVSCLEEGVLQRPHRDLLLSRVWVFIEGQRHVAHCCSLACVGCRETAESKAGCCCLARAAGQREGPQTGEGQDQVWAVS